MWSRELRPLQGWPLTEDWEDPGLEGAGKTARACWVSSGGRRKAPHRLGEQTASDATSASLS